MNIYCFSTLSFAKLQFKSVINKAFHKHGVASFTDAWIETVIISCFPFCIHIVASFTDAWIETVGFGSISRTDVSRIFYRCVDWNPVYPSPDQRSRRSHLLQMRGLKLTQMATEILGDSRIFYRCVDWNQVWDGKKYETLVASFTDAWIETTALTVGGHTKILSHLLQMRGLKPHCKGRKFGRKASHLLQMRGLKQLLQQQRAIELAVASFTDAWIETEPEFGRRANVWVASFTDAWIETTK